MLTTVAPERVNPGNKFSAVTEILTYSWVNLKAKRTRPSGLKFAWVVHATPRARPCSLYRPLTLLVRNYRPVLAGMGSCRGFPSHRTTLRRAGASQPPCCWRHHRPGEARRGIEDCAMLKLLRRFKKAEEGATLAEYGLLLALIAVICMAAITTLGSKISTMLSTVAGSI
jgi:pilus assembly protein Flp/PilA